MGEALANIQASENAWGVPIASQDEPGYTNHLWSVWQAAGSWVDSGMKLKISGGRGGWKDGADHLPIQVLPISPTFATFSGNQHLQALDSIHAGSQLIVEQISSEGAESRK